MVKRYLQQTAASWILLGTKPAQERYTFALVAERLILNERLVLGVLMIHFIYLLIRVLNI